MTPKFRGLKNNPSLLFQGLKTIKFYDLAVSILSQELEYGLAGWFSLGVPHTVSRRLFSGALCMEESQESFLWCWAGIFLGLFTKKFLLEHS